MPKRAARSQPKPQTPERSQPPAERPQAERRAKPAAGSAPRKLLAVSGKPALLLLTIFVLFKHILPYLAELTPAGVDIAAVAAEANRKRSAQNASAAAKPSACESLSFCFQFIFQHIFVPRQPLLDPFF